MIQEGGKLERNGTEIARRAQESSRREEECVAVNTYGNEAGENH